MTIGENLTHFHGLPVTDFSFESGISDPAGTAYRLNMGEDESLLDELTGVDDDLGDEAQYALVIEKLALADNAAKLRALVIGEWIEAFEMDATAILTALAEQKLFFPALEALFVGDMTYEQCEMSWIQTPMGYSTLLEAFPKLQRFAIRGEGPSLGKGISHEGLRALTAQTGGLGKEFVEQVCASQLPNLEELELWIGTGSYGRTTEVATLTPLLTGKLFPKLRRLGLMNAENADELAQAVASSPLLEQLEELDFSHGTLGDAGAEALLASPAVGKLKALALSHHYCSPGVVEKLTALEGVTVTADDPQGVSDDRYVMVGE